MKGYDDLFITAGELAGPLSSNPVSPGCPSEMGQTPSCWSCELVGSALAFLGLWTLGPFPHRTALLALGGEFSGLRSDLSGFRGGGKCWLFVSSLVSILPAGPLGGPPLSEWEDGASRGGPLSTTRWKPQVHACRWLCGRRLSVPPCSFGKVLRQRGPLSLLSGSHPVTMCP